LLLFEPDSVVFAGAEILFIVGVFDSEFVALFSFIVSITFVVFVELFSVVVLVVIFETSEVEAFPLFVVLDVEVALLFIIVVVLFSVVVPVLTIVGV
jgi:hypothetical protein